MLEQNRRDSREAAPKMGKMRKGGKQRDWCTTEHEANLEDSRKRVYVGMDLQHVVSWGHTE